MVQEFNCPCLTDKTEIPGALFTWEAWWQQTTAWPSCQVVPACNEPAMKRTSIIEGPAASSSNVLQHFRYFHVGL